RRSKWLRDASVVSPAPQASLQDEQAFRAAVAALQPMLEGAGSGPAEADTLDLDLVDALMPAHDRHAAELFVEGDGALVGGERPDDGGGVALLDQRMAGGAEQAPAKAQPLEFGREVELENL